MEQEPSAGQSNAGQTPAEEAEAIQVLPDDEGMPTAGAVEAVTRAEDEPRETPPVSDPEAAS